jgi:hypothetical protein
MERFRNLYRIYEDRLTIIRVFNLQTKILILYINYKNNLNNTALIIGDI